MSDARGERALLQRLADGPVSGDVLAGEAGLTRAAVWKRIEALREAGIAIEAAPGRGYRLAQPLDLLDIDTVRGAMPASISRRVFTSSSAPMSLSLSKSSPEVSYSPISVSEV